MPPITPSGPLNGSPTVAKRYKQHVVNNVNSTGSQTGLHHPPPSTVLTIAVPYILGATATTILYPTGSKTHAEKERQTGRQTDRQTNRKPTDRQTDR